MKKGLLVIFSMLVIACGGGSGDGGSGDSVTYSGEVLVNSGYTVTNVCFDRNNNKVCDTGELSAVTNGILNADGAFTIDGTASDANVNLIAEMTNGSANFVLEAVSGKHEAVSSITTMIKNRMDMTACSRNDAESKVSTDLGVSVGELYNTELNEKADRIAYTIVEILDKVGITFSSELMTVIYWEISEQLDKIKNNQEQTIVDNTNQTDINNKIDDVGKNISYVLSQGVYWFLHEPYSDVKEIYIEGAKLKNGVLHVTGNLLDKYANGAHILNTNININNFAIDILVAVNLESDGSLSFRLDEDEEDVNWELTTSNSAGNKLMKDMLMNPVNLYTNFPVLDETVNFSGTAREFSFKQDTSKNDNKIFITYNTEGIKQVINAYLSYY